MHANGAGENRCGRGGTCRRDARARGRQGRGSGHKTRDGADQAPSSRESSALTTRLTSARRGTRLFTAAPRGAKAMTAEIPGLTGDQISALETLAGFPNGCAEAEIKAKGFRIGLLGALIRLGYAKATPGIVEVAGRSVGIVRLEITEK